MITPKGYPPLSNLKSRAIWARQQRGWSMIEAMDKYNAGNSPEKQVSWLVLRQIERGQQDSTDEHLLEGLANLYKVDPQWFKNGPVARSAPAPAETETETEDEERMEPEPVTLSPQVETTQTPTAPTLRYPTPRNQKALVPGSFGAKVRAARQAMGLSQGAVARAIGVSGQTVSLVEINPEGVLSPGMIRKVLDFYGLDLEIPGQKKAESYVSRPEWPRLGKIPGAARRIRRQRDILGITQTELAARVGVPPWVISHIERGQSTSRADVEKLATALETTPDYILKGVSGLPNTSPAPQKTVSPSPAPKVEAKTRAEPAEAPRTAAAMAPKGDIVPRQVTDIGVAAVTDTFYMFMSRKTFRRVNQTFEGQDTIFGSYSMSPNLAVALRDQLNEFIADYERNVGPIS